MFWFAVPRSDRKSSRTRTRFCFDWKDALFRKVKMDVKEVSVNNFVLLKELRVVTAFVAPLPSIIPMAELVRMTMFQAIDIEWNRHFLGSHLKPRRCARFRQTCHCSRLTAESSYPFHFAASRFQRSSRCSQRKNRLDHHPPP